MKTPHRVVWSEGMLMQPQHLQQLDQYHESLLAARVAAVAPIDWGVLSSHIDGRALQAGQLRIEALECVFPDGLPVGFDARVAGVPVVRPIEAHFPPTQKVLEVFVGVPTAREGVRNYAQPGDEAAAQSARYLCATRNVYDGTGTGAGEAAVAFARPNVFVLFGDEPRETFDAIKIAEIVRDSTGALIVSDTYIPPCRRVSASPGLMAGLRRILALTASRQRVLAEARRQREGSTVEFGAADITRYLLLNAVNTFVPVLGYLVDHGHASPEATYLLLVQFAGQLSTFAADADPTTLPRFQYNDLRATFEELFARITALLHRTVREGYLTVPLEMRADGVYFGRLADERLARTTTFLLSVRSDLPEAQLAEQVPRLAKIASWEDINHVISSATPGVPVQVTFRPPAEVPIRAGVLYFALNTGDRFWRNVLAERAIALYLPLPLDTSRVHLELLAVPPAQA